MSTTIDQKVVEMRFDNNHFENNVQTSLHTLNKLKGSLDMSGASKGFESINTAARGVNLSGLGSAVETVGLKFNAMYTVADQALRNITNSVMNTGKKMVEALTIDPIKTGFNEYETKINAIQTIMSNTASKGTTMEDVTRVIGELNEYADKTIYNFAEMTRNIGTFTAAGIGLEESASAIQGIANLAAASGSSSQQASTAMYQLSQALSTGTVRLMDWNSVVNAGMGGEKFQMALKATAREHGVAVDDIIEKNGSFRDSLQEGWLTADILNTTLQKFTTEGAKDYAKSMMEAGKWTQEEADALLAEAQAMEDAATKVKTFTQLWDTLKESAQSGWSQTWEIIVGDFEEAKETLTEFSKVIGGMIEASAKARNELLQGWKDAGGRADLVESIFNIFYAVMEVVKPIKEAFQEIFPPLTVQRLVDFTSGLKEMTGRFRELVSASDVFDKIKRTFKGLFAVVDIVRMVFTSLIGSVFSLSGSFGDLGGGILTVTAKIGDWLVKLHDTIEQSNTLGTVFGTVAKVIRGAIGKIIDICKALWPAVKDVGSVLASAFETISKWIGGAIGKASDVLKGLAPTMKKVGGVFESFAGVISKVVQYIVTFAQIIGTVIFGVFSALGPIVQGVAEAFKKFGSYLKEKLVFPGLDSFRDVLEKTKEKMSSLSDSATDMKDRVADAITGMGTAIANSGFYKGLVKIWDVVKKVGAAIGGAFKKVFDFLGEKLGNIKFDGILDVVNTASLGGIAVAIMSFLKKCRKPFEEFEGLFDGLKSILEGVRGILDGVRGCFEAYQTKLKADALTKIATAIAILVAAIVVLSMIDSAKLTAAIVAITTLFADLMTSMALVNKMSGPVGGLTKICTAMIAVSIAVLLMASALKSISNLDSDSLSSGLIGVVGLTAVVVAMAKILGKDGGTITKGTGQLILLALAVKVLAGVAKDMAQMNWEEIGKGLVGVAGLMAGVIAFTKLGGGASGMISTGLGMIAVAAALKIMASVCSDFAGMNWDEIGKSLAGVGGLLLELGAFAKLGGGASGMIATGIGIIAIGAAMKILTGVMQDMASMSWEELGKGLVGIAGSLASIALAMQLLPTDTAIIGAGLVVVADALTILGQVLSAMGSMSWEEIAKGLVALAGSMVILAASLNLMNGTLAGSAALLVAAGALAILAPVLTTLGALSWEQVAIGLVSIAGAFTIMGVAGLVLGPLTPVIIALAGALALIGVAVLGVGTGMLAAGTGLTLLAAGLTAFAAALSGGATVIVAGLTAIILGIASLIPSIAVKIGEGIIQIAQVIAEGAPVLGEAVKAVALALLDIVKTLIPALVETVLSIATAILEAIAEYSPRIVQAVLDILLAILRGVANNISAVVQAGVDIVVGFLDGVAKSLPKVINAGFELIISFVDGLANAIDNNIDRLIAAGNKLFNALINAALKLLTNSISQIKEKGGAIMKGLKEGISNAGSKITNAVKDIMSTARDKISEWTSKFKSVGGDIMNGLINGVKEKINSVVNSVKDVGSKALAGIKDLLGIKSPSREFMEVGKYSGEGLVVGLQKYSGKVASAAEGMGSAALDSMKGVVAGIADAINSDVDSQPVIRPVLDLSDVKSGAGAIDGFFGMTPSVGVLSNVGSIGVMMNRNQNRGNSDVVSAINELKGALGSGGGNTYNVNGIDYQEGDNVAEALKTIIRAAKVERRS